MDIVISVIIPVYKVERYLRKCIESVISQSYRKIEIILVDDGSPDNSGLICDEYAVKDDRVKVVHKTNGGLSDARNMGLKVSTGDYVMFIDSDDYWVNSESLSQLVEILKSGDYDFVGFNCSYYYPSTDKYQHWRYYGEKITRGNDKFALIIELVKSGTFPMSACLKVIKRDFLLVNKIDFIKGIIAEDIPWFLSLLSHARSIKFVNLYMYAYRKEVAGSITSNFSLKSYNDLFNTLKEETNKILNSSYPEKVQAALLSFMAYEFCILLGMIRNFDFKIQYKYRQELLNYKWLLKYTLNPKVKYCSYVNRLFGIKITELLLFKFLSKKYN